jgi:ABC-type transporter Mla MlaB component
MDSWRRCTPDTGRNLLMKLTLLPLENDNLIRVKCEGPITSPHLTSDKDPLEALLGPHCYTHRVLMNLEKVRSIDTGGVCWLLRLQKHFQANQGRIVLYLVPGVVSDVLDIMRLTPLLHIALDEAAAREMAGKSAEPPLQPERFPRRDSSPTDGNLR